MDSTICRVNNITNFIIKRTLFVQGGNKTEQNN